MLYGEFPIKITMENHHYQRVTQFSPRKARHHNLDHLDLLPRRSHDRHGASGAEGAAHLAAHLSKLSESPRKTSGKHVHPKIMEDD